MRLSPARFNGFLNGAVAQAFGWRRSYACPCFNQASGQAKAECPLCKGKGHQWDDEVTANCNAGMTNQTPGKTLKDFGTWEPGDATFTIPNNSALYAAGRFDRIRALNSTNPFSMNLIRGKNDTLLGSVVSINRVFWLTPDGTATVDGDIPDVNDDGSLSWDSGAPAVGTQYSISGVKYDEFYVFTSLSSDRNNGISGLPMKLLARVYDLFGR